MSYREYKPMEREDSAPESLLSGSDEDEESLAEEQIRSKQNSRRGEQEINQGSGDYESILKRNEEKWAQRLSGVIVEDRLRGDNATNTTRLKMDAGLFASLLGMQEGQQLSSFVFVMVGFFSIVMATFVTTLEVNEAPHLVPPDFEEKGTLSNCAQDITQPNGRMFTVGLFTFGLLFLIGHYTVWLYRPWAPWVDPIQPFESIHFESNREKHWRCAWLLIPNVFLMFTAAIPSLSDTEGYKFWLMLTHNICAPLGMAFAMYMETTQLNFGENAFEYFFSSDPTPIYGPLTVTQRARVVCCVMAWIHGAIFLSIQIYLGLGTIVGLKIPKNYGLALISYYGEVGGMSLVALLPTLAGLGTQLEQAGLPSILHLAARMEV